METTLCQSCGMVLGDPGFYGTNCDDSRNDDYCIYCFAGGEFTEDISMEDVIGMHAEIVESRHDLAEDEKEEYMVRVRETISSLARWRDDL